MARPLVVTAIAGIGISIACFLLAAIISPFGTGYPFVPTRPYNQHWWNFRPPWAGHVPFVESGDLTTRKFDWTGGETAEIYIPGVVRFEAAPAWSVIASGPKSSVEHLRIDSGAILFDAPMAYPHRSALEVVIRGPRLTHVGLNGTGKLILGNVAQPELGIDLRGSGSVEGGGRVDRLELRLFGSGNARLEDIATQDFEASIYGSGSADVAPTGNVQVTIFGSGDIRLHARPKSVSKKVMGSGRIVELDAHEGSAATGRESIQL